MRKKNSYTWAGAQNVTDARPDISELTVENISVVVETGMCWNDLSNVPERLNTSK